MGKKSVSGSGMNNPDHISESLETIFGVKIHKFFDADPGSGIKKFGSAIHIEKKSDPGSGINTPDPQHCATYSTTIKFNKVTKSLSSASTTSIQLIA
jgi:hypothetical protein